MNSYFYFSGNRFIKMKIRSIPLLAFCLLLHVIMFSQEAEERCKELGIELPELSDPVANYVHAVRVGNLLFLAGKGPSLADGTYITGKVGKDLTIEEGYAAARRTAIMHLAVLKQELGDLNKVNQLIKVLGMVNAPDDFTEHSKVMNGYSDLMMEVFGEKGKHARSSVGMCSLPFNIALEVELIAEIRE